MGTHGYVYITACVVQSANTSDTQALGHGFEPRMDH